MSSDRTIDSSVSIKSFSPILQEEVKTLIVEGLIEHWGYNDLLLNSDLDDISANYDHSTFLVALNGDGKVVGTGAIIRQSNTEAEIVRMSVAKKWRGQGIGTVILDQLCNKASFLGYKRLILETTSDWKEAVLFYCNFGFQITHEQDGEFGRNTYFALDIS